MQLLLLNQRISSFFYSKKIGFLSKIIDGINYIIFNSFFPGSVRVGKGSICAYGGIGLVIHKRTVIGENCIIGQGITIGGRSKKYKVPEIGDDVYLGAGCRVLGPIKIGDNVVIGPNSVVLNDIPSGCIVVGIPGKIVKTNIKMRDYV